MRIEGQRQSSNIEDRRGMSPGMMAGGGVVSIIVVIVALFLGIDPRPLLQQMPQSQVQTNGPVQSTPEEEQLKSFVSVVLADTEDVWTDLFKQMGKQYNQPKLVLFRGSVQSACGSASAAVGPFYCPGDQKVYIDLDFYDQLKRQLHSPGDFAQAYVIAHEIGHHVQHELGLTRKADAMRGRVSEAEQNAISVRVELQADFLAGVWASHAQKMKGILEAGDIEEAMNAAKNIGDDALQKQSQGYVVPDSFTHGSSAQRMKWFMKGFQTGDIRQGDTFSIPEDGL